MTTRKARTWKLGLTVVGLNFRWTKGGRETLARNCPIPVTLEREPDNKYDPNAVKVLIAADYKLKALKGKHLGYLRRGVAEAVGPRLDAGTIEVVSLWVTSVDAASGDADVDARFRDLKPVKKASKRKISANA